jgi:hypothetical protein
MAILKPQPVSTRQLTFLPAEGGDHGKFVAEISETHGFGRVYDDACDEGLTVVSATTGREVVYVVERTEVRDGELVAWYLEPAELRLRGSLPSLTLFND